jgi:hypothetical protein
LLSLATCSATSEPANDWLIVPGVRIGPISAKSTRANLVQMFGTNNVEDGNPEMDDDPTESRTFVSFPQPNQTVDIVWAAGMKGTRIQTILLSQNPPFDSKWHTVDGITLGTTLQQLEKLNKRPFALAGFDWDESGVVTSWRGGALHQKLETSCGSMDVRLDPDPGANYDPQLSGEASILSSLPAMHNLNPKVILIVIDFKPCQKK